MLQQVVICSRHEHGREHVSNVCGLHPLLSIPSFHRSLPQGCLGVGGLGTIVSSSSGVWGGAAAAKVFLSPGNSRNHILKHYDKLYHTLCQLKRQHSKNV